MIQITYCRQQMFVNGSRKCWIKRSDPIIFILFVWMNVGFQLFHFRSLASYFLNDQSSRIMWCDHSPLYLFLFLCWIIDRITKILERRLLFNSHFQLTQNMNSNNMNLPPFPMSQLNNNLQSVQVILSQTNALLRTLVLACLVLNPFLFLSTFFCFLRRRFFKWRRHVSPRHISPSLFAKSFGEFPSARLPVTSS